jgi:cytosine/uracil/thiamine/allantoin permease
MEKLNPWKFGAVLSVTVLINYILCTIFWYAFTGPAIDLLNALFHGLDFRKLQMVAAAFSVAGFAYALIVLMVWAYLVGAIYALVRNWLRPEQEKPRP